MAQMYPSDIEGLPQATEGEKKVFRFLKEIVRPDETFTCWYEPEIRGQRPDFILYGEDFSLLVPLPGGSRPSQNDIFILAKGGSELVTIMIEGKVSEPFGDTVAEWMKDDGEGKQKRLEFLRNKLQIRDDRIDAIRYQLLHRTASAIIEAERFNAENALMMVHSFSPGNEGFDDYRKFFAFYGLEGEIDSLVFVRNIHGINLHLGWVQGDQRYLSA